MKKDTKNMCSLCTFNCNVKHDSCDHIVFKDKTLFSSYLGIPDFNNVVYICSPYSGDIDKNISNAEKFANWVYEIGQIPLTPHFLFPFIKKENDRKERSFAIYSGLELLRRCDYLFLFKTNKGITNGMQIELKYARNIHIPVVKINTNIVWHILNMISGE